MGKQKKKLDVNSNSKYKEIKDRNRRIRNGKPYIADCRGCGNTVTYFKNGTVCPICNCVLHYTDEKKDYFTQKRELKIKLIKQGKDVFR